MELDDLEIGKNIRRYRQQRGMRQKELAERIHVSDQHISHIENGYTKLSLVSLVGIANALQVDCNTLLGATLTEAKKTILHQKLAELTADMDTKQLALTVEFCSMLAEYDLDERQERGGTRAGSS